jgi:hypothetical protein
MNSKSGELISNDLFIAFEHTLFQLSIYKLLTQQNKCLRILIANRMLKWKIKVWNFSSCLLLKKKTLNESLQSRVCSLESWTRLTVAVMLHKLTVSVCVSEAWILSDRKIEGMVGGILPALANWVLAFWTNLRPVSMPQSHSETFCEFQDPLIALQYIFFCEGGDTQSLFCYQTQVCLLTDQ